MFLIVIIFNFIIHFKIFLKKRNYPHINPIKMYFLTKEILMMINRINVLILKRCFNRKIRFKIKWDSPISILNNMMYNSRQILDRLFYKTRDENILSHLFMFIYVIISCIINLFLLTYLYFYIIIMNIKDNSDKNIKTKHIVEKYIKTEYIRDENHYKVFTELTRCKLNSVINEDKYIIEDKLNIHVDSYSPLYTEKIHKDALFSLTIDNAGGGSNISEFWSMNHLSNKLNSKKCIYEMSVKYWCKYKMIDYILELENERIGVSVVRAFNYFDMEFLFEDALRILSKKINGLIMSRKTVTEDHNFYKSILHIWSPSNKTTKILFECLESDELNINSLNIIGSLDIWITTTEYKPIFNNGNNYTKKYCM